MADNRQVLSTKPLFAYHVDMRPELADSRVLVDEVVARLEQLIVTGRLKPGEKLIEQAFSARFGISRAPLREAIRTLEARHSGRGRAVRLRWWSSGRKG
jgi:DNA-binding FadR family transcriptional regulator